ncbi:MAG: hypothetical protein ACYC3X_28635 [Pirellulaceae bacterium]
MSVNLFKTIRYVVIAMTVSIWATGWGSTAAYAQCCSQHGGHAGHEESGSAGHQHESAPAEHTGHDQPAPPPHGGQLTTLKPLSFEVVYQPKEIRVYIYGPLPQPPTEKAVKGEISLQRRSDQRVVRLVLRHVVPPKGEQNYLSAPVDLSRIKDGEVTATIELENVPLVPHATATFTQDVVLSQTWPDVVLATLDPSDRALVARQKVCPVTGAALDSMGGPVKVLVGRDRQPLYLCCQGCLGKVQSDPEGYLRQANPTKQGQ